MWKRKVESNLIGSIIDFRKLIKELQESKLTGFVKIEGWDFTDYLVLYSGKPIKVIRKRDNQKEFIEFSDYKPSEDTKISVYESSPLLTAHIGKILSLYRYQTLIFSGYGDEVFFSQLEIVDFKKFEEFLRKTDFTGYFTLYTPIRVLGNFFCLYGEIVGVNCRNLWDEEAFEELKSYGDERFLSAYHIPPEEVHMFLSMKGGLKEGRNGTGFNVSEGGIFQLVHEGLVIKTIRITDEDIKESDISSQVEGTFYGVDFRQDFSPLRLNLELLQGGDKESYVEAVLLNKVREIFVDCMGPIGGILFKRILGEYTSRQDRIPKRSFMAFLKHLEREIPEEDLKEEFRRKLEEVIDQTGSQDH